MTSPITTKTIREWVPVWAVLATILLAVGGLVQRVSELESKQTDDAAWKRSVDRKLTKLLCLAEPSNCLSREDDK